MWRRLGGIVVALTLGSLALGSIAHGEGSTTTTTPGDVSTTTEPTTTTAATTTTEPTTSAVEPTVAMSLLPAVPGTRVQLTPTLPEPTTTTAAPAPDPGAATEVPAGSGTGRRVIYAKRAQRVWLVEGDESVVRTYRVSGRRDQPDPGVFHVWSRSNYTCSINNSHTCMRWMVRFAHGPEGGNIGFHEIPRLDGVPLQRDSQLGTPLSHGCVRQSTDDAQLMWSFAGIGTTVVVVA